MGEWTHVTQSLVRVVQAAFEPVQLGVRTYMQKPPDFEIAPPRRAIVGHEDPQKAEEEVGQTMNSVRNVSRVLVVEDSIPLRNTLQRSLESRFDEVRGVGSVSEGRRELASFGPHLIVLDVELPDGTAIDLVRAALERDTFPLVVAISGTASPDQAFELAQLGVRTYLAKPIELDALEAALDRAIRAPVEVRPLLRTVVGQRPIQDVEDELRQTMLREALCQANGSRRGAARLLHVSRQLVQHMLRRHEIH